MGTEGITMSTRSTRDVAPSPYRDGAQRDADLQLVAPADVQVHEAKPVQVEPRRGWWGARTTLEKIGVFAIGLAAGAVGVALAAPRFVKATVGGGLTGAGAWLLREGFGKPRPDNRGSR